MSAPLSPVFLSSEIQYLPTSGSTLENGNVSTGTFERDYPDFPGARLQMSLPVVARQAPVSNVPPTSRTRPLDNCVPMRGGFRELTTKTP